MSWRSGTSHLCTFTGAIVTKNNQKGKHRKGWFKEARREIKIPPGDFFKNNNKNYVNLFTLNRAVLRLFLLFHPGHAGQDQENSHCTQQAECSVEHIVKRQRHPEISSQHQNR